MSYEFHDILNSTTLSHNAVQVFSETLYLKISSFFFQAYGFKDILKGEPHGIHVRRFCHIVIRAEFQSAYSRFDPSLGRAPVERPFHHLWTYGDETEKKPPCAHVS